MTEEALSWLATLPRPVQAALLADPGGDLPPDLITRVPTLVVKTYWDSNPHAGRWELHPQYAAAVRQGRTRLDNWWHDLPPHTRAALVEHRDGQVPNEHRAAVGGLGPLGVAVYADATTAGPFRLHPVVIAYLDFQVDTA